MVIGEGEKIKSIPFKHILIFAGLVVDQYIVKTDKDLKRVKIKASDNKRIGDQIKIEKL
jgi:hypothetical protein